MIRSLVYVLRRVWRDGGGDDGGVSRFGKYPRFVSWLVMLFVQR